MVDLPPSRRLWRRVAVMYALGAPFILIGVVSAFDSHGGERLQWLLILALVLGIPLLHFPMRRRWVRRFDERGATTYSGRTFEWKDFQRVELVKQRRYNSYRELVFATGRAVVPPGEMILNPSELSDVVTELSRGENRFAKK
jgi:hypothetical protein